MCLSDAWVGKLLRGLFKALLILLIVNVFDAIICILVPIIIHEMHSFPSFTDTLDAVFFVPEHFRTGMPIDFFTVRSLALVALSLILTALTSKSRSEAILHYIGLILLVMLLTFVNDIVTVLLSSAENLFNELNLKWFLSVLFYRIIIFICHIPLSFCSLGIFLIARKYRAAIIELEALERF